MAGKSSEAFQGYRSVARTLVLAPVDAAFRTLSQMSADHVISPLHFPSLRTSPRWRHLLEANAYPHRPLFKDAGLANKKTEFAHFAGECLKPETRWRSGVN